MKAVEEAPPKPKTMTAYCARDGCDEPVYSRGRCRKHYQNDLYHKKKAKEGKTVAPKEPKRESYVAQGDTCNEPPRYKKVAEAKPAKADAVTFLRSRAKEEYEKELAEVEARYKTNLEAIEIVARLSKDAQ